MLVNIQRLKKW